VYSQLDLRHILATIDALHSRIGERFPDSGLQKVAAELHWVGEETAPMLERAARPHWPLRIAVTFIVTLFALLAGALFWYIGSLPFDVDGRGDMLQSVESATQVLIFFSVALFFFVTLESRLKRRVALRELHRLRSIVHVTEQQAGRTACAVSQRSGRIECGERCRDAGSESVQQDLAEDRDPGHDSRKRGEQCLTIGRTANPTNDLHDVDLSPRRSSHQ
jgi:hypothetical protein